MLTTILSALLFIVPAATPTPTTAAATTVSADSSATVAVDVEPLCI